jgi:predicted metal-dependent hydrolase
VLRLFVTCAIEHITYSLSRFHLTRMEFLDQCSPAYRRLWLWHALEEIEHSAVAMQVLRAATPRMRPWKRYLARISVFNAVVSAMFSISLRNTAAIVRRQHPGAGPRTWLRLGWVLLGPPGLLRGMLPLLAAYYRPGFAGTAPSDALLVEKARGSLLAAMPAAVPA